MHEPEGDLAKLLDAKLKPILAGFQFLETILRADHKRLGIFDAPNNRGQHFIEVRLAFQGGKPSLIVLNKIGIHDLDVFDLLAQDHLIRLHHAATFASTAFKSWSSFKAAARRSAISCSPNSLLRQGALIQTSARSVALSRRPQAMLPMSDIKLSPCIHG